MAHHFTEAPSHITSINNHELSSILRTPFMVGWTTVKLELRTGTTATEFEHGSGRTGTAPGRERD